MTIVYSTRGTSLPAKSPLRSGTGLIMVEDVGLAYNHGLPAPFDYDLLYEENDVSFRALKRAQGGITECFPDSGFVPRRVAICKTDGVEIVFDNFPTRRMGGTDNGGRIIRSSLYLKFGPDEIKNDVDGLVSLFMDAKLTGIATIVDGIVPDNNTLIAFRAKSSAEKSDWLQGKFLDALRAERNKKFFEDLGGKQDKVNAKVVRDLLMGTSSGSVFAAGSEFINKPGVIVATARQRPPLSSPSMDGGKDRRSDRVQEKGVEPSLRLLQEHPLQPDPPTPDRPVSKMPMWAKVTAIFAMILAIVYLVVNAVSSTDKQNNNVQYTEEKGK